MSNVLLFENFLLYIDTTVSDINLSMTYLTAYGFLLLFNQLGYYIKCIGLNALQVLTFKVYILNSIVFAFKFIILIALFIFIRGGIPRYRYDFLTKMGWIKFLSLVLSTFLISILLTYLL